MKNVGLQLYTVRSLLSNPDEIRKTLKAVKEIGYDSVQLFGSVELLENCSEIAAEEGLKVIGTLMDLNSCEKSEEKLFEVCEKYGISDIGVSTCFSECQAIDSYVPRLNAFAKKAKSRGFTFSYHNHGHEFIRLDCGETAMNRFLREFDTDVDFMPDTYWLHDGGYDVRHFLEQTEGRVKILHLKDLKRTGNGHTFAEVGNGNLYFEGIIKTALQLGINSFVVEQDICEGDPLISAKQSYDYIKSLKLL